MTTGLSSWRLVFTSCNCAQAGEPRFQARRPVIELIQAQALHGVDVEGAGSARAEIDVLDRLEEDAHARHAGSLAPQILQDGA